MFLIFFFFNDTATTEIYTLSLHDALPIFDSAEFLSAVGTFLATGSAFASVGLIVLRHDPHIAWTDRKSTRLNSSHSQISYAVFCLKKKNNHIHYIPISI